jgi:hypothetical protein
VTGGHNRTTTGEGTNCNRVRVRWRCRREQPGIATQETPAMSRSSIRRTAVLAVLAPLTTAGLIAAAGSASAIPFEGDPTPSTCLRLERLPDAPPPGGPVFISSGYALVLSQNC